VNAQPKRRFEEHKEGNRFVVLDSDHPAARDGRTLFPSTVRASSDEARLLKAGEHQRKIGSHVVKGRWAGMPIFTLTLEERATCPRSCKHWLDCMGNRMHWATRISPDERFLEQLDGELYGLSINNLSGFVVRLHILGDFFSPAYVAAWGGHLQRYLPLHVFGYTARTPSDPIGKEIDRLNHRYPGRWHIRFSNGDAWLPRTVTIDRPEQAGKAVICPAQTGQTACCGTCALCWSTDKPIAFLRH
jgi:hypothetical protein